LGLGLGLDQVWSVNLQIFRVRFSLSSDRKIMFKTQFSKGFKSNQFLPNLITIYIEALSYPERKNVYFCQSFCTLKHLEIECDALLLLRGV